MPKRDLPKRAYEDFPPGLELTLGPRHVTRDEIVAFAAEFDPQPMHLDEEAGRRSMLGGLAGSGWHTCCLMMRLIADEMLAQSTSMGSHGVEEIKWIAPLRPDSDITVKATVTGARRSRSRPEMGLVNFRYDVHDQHGTHIMAVTSTMMLGTRESQPA